MITFPNAKVNLGLYITNKRADGFHDLQTCFIPVPWKDGLEIIEAPKLSFSSSGLSIPGENPEDNLCLKAYQSVKKDHDLPPVHIHLHKNIPIGAGLGGGSSDAAFTVKLLNEKFNLGLSETQMEEYVRPLGSDCAFFIRNRPTLAHGKGDQFSSLDINLEGLHILLIYPGIHVSTKEAYSGVKPHVLFTSLEEILLTPRGTWKTHLHNQFEDTVFPQYPELSRLKQQLYDQGAMYSSMSGSGSCVFGLFTTAPPEIELPDGYKVQGGALTGM